MDSDATELRAWERIMMDCFTERQLSELDERCWLVVEAYATIEQDQIPRVRMGQLPQIGMKREEEKEEELEGEETVETEEQPEKMEVEKKEESKEEPERGEERLRPIPRMMSREKERAGRPRMRRITMGDVIIIGDFSF